MFSEEGASPSCQEIAQCFPVISKFLPPVFPRPVEKKLHLPGVDGSAPQAVLEMFEMVHLGCSPTEEIRPALWVAPKTYCFGALRIGFSKSAFFTHEASINSPLIYRL